MASFRPGMYAIGLVHAPRQRVLRFLQHFTIVENHGESPPACSQSLALCNVQSSLLDWCLDLACSGRFVHAQIHQKFHPSDQL